MKHYQVINNDVPVCSAGCADNYFLRLRGLIGRDISALGGLWIKPCNQIHTCFMSYPIDVVYLSKELEILQIDPRLEPGRFFKAVRHARSVLELPAGAAETYSLKAGDRLGFSSKTDPSHQSPAGGTNSY